MASARPPEPVDPDVDLGIAAQHAEGRRPDVLAAVSLGGVVGAEARYGLGVLWPNPPSAFPWATLVVNVSGCVAIGVLMVVLVEVWATPHRLARPFLGVGVLGGYTTFSTFAVDGVQLLRDHRPGPAAGYVLGTLCACLAGVALAAWVTRRVAGRR